MDVRRNNIIAVRRVAQKQSHSPRAGMCRNKPTARAPMPAHNHHANDNTKLTTMNIALNIPLGEFPMCDTIDKRFANMV